MNPSPLAGQHLASRLRFRHLQLLVALRGGGSLRAAAADLNLTQPALSKALAEIESAFGLPLFVRGARGLKPTSAGEVVIRSAALMLAELAHLDTQTRLTPGVTVLNIGAPPFVAQEHLPAALARLLQGHAGLRVRLQEERVPELTRRLLAGEVDALVTSLPQGVEDGELSRLRYERLFEARFAVIAPPGHALARQRAVQWSQLAQADWIMGSAGSMVRHIMEETFRRAGHIMPAPVLESTNPVTNLRLVAAGVGVCMVPDDTARHAIAQGLVHRLAVRRPLTSWPVALVYRDGPGNPRVALLRQALGLGPADAGAEA